MNLPTCPGVVRSTPSPLRGLCLASAAAFATLAAWGAEPAPAGSDDVISLSEFAVTAGAQNGYISSESMSGSRISTKIKDLPYNIGVITSEFFDDFNILDNSQIFQSGVVTDDQDAGGGYSVRGISSSGQLYNGFWQPAGTVVPNALKDREEILKGPSAGAYGQTSPGGMKNIVSKQPRSTPHASIRATVGNYHARAGRFETTGPLTPRTSYLLVGSYDERGFNKPWQHDRSRALAFSLKHNFANEGTLRVEIVAASQRNHSPANRVPYLYDSTKQAHYGIAYSLMNLSGTGPNSYKNNDNYSAFAIYEKRLNEIFSLRLGTDYYAAHSRSFNTTDVTTYDPDPTHARADLYSSTFYGLSRLRSASSSYSAPSYKLDYSDGGGFQGDLLAHYFALNRQMDNRTLLTLDYSSRYNYIIKKGIPQPPKLNTDGTAKLNPDGSVQTTSNTADSAVFPLAPRFAGDTSYWIPVINPFGPQTYNDPVTGFPINIYNLPNPSSDQYILSSWQKARTDVFGAMLRQQTTLWNRLHLFAAGRYDHVIYNNFSLQYPTWSLTYHPQLAPNYDASFRARNTGQPVSHYSVNAFTPSGGASYSLARGVSVYANYSTSFKASTQQITGATTTSYFLPNERAEGIDYGLKGAMLDERLTWSLGGYYILQKNISVTVDDGLGGTIKEASGTVLSRGLEFSANYNVNANWAFNLDYSHINATWGDTGNDRDLSGRSKARIPSEIGTAMANYKFTRFARGLRLYGMFQYTGPTGAEDSNKTGLRQIGLPSYYLVNLGTAYEFSRRTYDRSLKHRIQFNVGNALNHPYITYSRGVGDYRTYKLTYQVSF